jgi:hypothetical protein
MVCCEHTQDPANRHERDEQIKSHEQLEMNKNGLTLVLSTPEKPSGQYLGFICDE